jgi:hypothetical protein
MTNKLNGLTSASAHLLSQALQSLQVRPNQIEDKDYLLNQLEVILTEFCESCEGKGYLEVSHDDNNEYIEACETCDYFGIMEFDKQPSLNDRAIEKAKADGVKVTKNGRVKC